MSSQPSNANAFLKSIEFIMDCKQCESKKTHSSLSYNPKFKISVPPKQKPVNTKHDKDDIIK